MNLGKMTSGKIFANGYNEIMMNVFHLLEYNVSLGPQHLSNDASFVIFCVKEAGRRPIKITAYNTGFLWLARFLEVAAGL